MNWVTIVWSMSAAVSLTLGAIHFVVWLEDRKMWANLFFALAAVAVAGIAIAEFAMMTAQTPQQIGKAQQWGHVPIFLLVIAIIGFVRLYFGTGRLWLGVAACAARAASLVMNFALPPNLNFRQVTGVRHLEFLGQAVSVPEGVGSSGTYLGELSAVLLLAFVVDASVALWRQRKLESRRRAVVVGGSITVFIIIAAGIGALVSAQIIHWPYLISLPFLGIIVAMGFELSYDVLHAAALSRRLQASEEGLRESEERIRLAADAVNLGIWEWDLRKDEIWATNARRALLGWPASGKITLEDFISRLHPDDRDRIRQAIDDAIHKGKNYDSEYRLVLPDGIVRWMATRGSVQFDANGKPKRLRGISFDITARKQAEWEAHERRDQLNHLSRVAAMGELATSIAHELNQPLSGITINAGTAQRLVDHGEVDLSELREVLGDILADGRRAGEVIRGIQSMVKKGSSVRQRVDLNDVVTNVVRMANPNAILRSCELETLLEPNLPPIEANPVQLQQVLINLIMNALDAMQDTPAGNRKVIIATKSSRDGAIRTIVRDYGTGIPEEMCERMFEQFFTTKAKGLGMGLAIARSIIKSHGGTIAAENANGGGACFHFTLPASPSGSLPV